MTNTSPFISIIIPCRNEQKFIGKCLDSIIAQDYPKELLEVLIVDGMSNDRTREIIKEYVHQHKFIKLLDNSKKIVPTALNIGIKHAQGEIIIRMDAHATYKENYITKCVRYLVEYNADNVGGIWKIIPRNNSLIGKAIAMISSSPFGVGNAHYRLGSLDKPKWVDTVFGGCYRKKVFERIGLFNENLVRTQDLELNIRLRKAGGKILLVPDIVTNYYTRSDFMSFLKYNFVNSFWVTYPRKYLNYLPVSLRHLIPMIFVLSLLFSGILSISFDFKIFFLLFLLIVGSYFLSNLFFTLLIVFRKKDIRYLFVVPILFTSLHVSYGLGSLWGFIRALF